MRVLAKALVIKMWTLVFMGLCALLAAPALSHADVSWVQNVTSCTAFAEGIKGHVGQIKDFKNLSDHGRGELNVVLHEACGSRFRRCNFSVCRAFGFERKANDGAIVRDPLAWMDQNLTCRELKDQLKTRYAPLGKFSDMPESKKVELRYILDSVCSERFAHCNFKRCSRIRTAGQVESTSEPEKEPELANEIVRKIHRQAEQSDARVETKSPEVRAAEELKATIEEGKTEEASLTAAVSEGQVITSGPTVRQEALAEAEQEYQRLLQEEYAKRRAMMEVALEYEQEQGLQWRRFGNEDELTLIKERQKKASEEKTKKQQQDQDQNNFMQRNTFSPAGRKVPTVIPKTPRAPVGAPQLRNTKPGQSSGPIQY